MNITESTPKVNQQNTTEYDVEVLEFQRHTGSRSSIAATCRVRVNQIVFANVRVIMAPLASRPFVAMPSRYVAGTWQPLVSVLSPSLEKSISDAVLAAWYRGGR